MIFFVANSAKKKKSEILSGTGLINLIKIINPLPNIGNKKAPEKSEAFLSIKENVREY